MVDEQQCSAQHGAAQQQQAAQPACGVDAEALEKATPRRGVRRLTNDAKVATVQEKNRLTQRAFRQRQKDRLITLSQQVEQLNAQVAMLQSRSAQLAELNAHLMMKLDKQRSSDCGSGSTQQQQQLQPSSSALTTQPQRWVSSKASSKGTALSGVDRKQLWRSTIETLGAALVRYNAHPCDATRIALEQTVDTIFGNYFKGMQEDPEGFCRMNVEMATLLNATLSEEDAVMLRRNVRQQLQLTPQQQWSIANAWRQYEHRHSTARQTRQRLTETWLGTKMKCRQELKEFMEFAINDSETSDRLKSLLHDERMAFKDMLQDFHGCMTAEQNARLLVRSSPFYSDCMMQCYEVYQEVQRNMMHIWHTQNIPPQPSWTIPSTLAPAAARDVAHLGIALLGYGSRSAGSMLAFTTQPDPEHRNAVATPAPVRQERQLRKDTGCMFEYDPADAAAGVTTGCMGVNDRAMAYGAGYIGQPTSPLPPHVLSATDNGAVAANACGFRGYADAHMHAQLTRSSDTAACGSAAADAFLHTDNNSGSNNACVLTDDLFHGLLDSDVELPPLSPATVQFIDSLGDLHAGIA